MQYKKIPIEEISPIKPSYVVRAVAPEGGPMHNQDLQILIKIGDMYYSMESTEIELHVQSDTRVTMDVNVNVHDMRIDMPASLINEDGIISQARISVGGTSDNKGHAIYTSSDVSSVTADSEIVCTDSLILRADGNADTPELVVFTKSPPTGESC